VLNRIAESLHARYLQDVDSSSEATSLRWRRTRRSLPIAAAASLVTAGLVVGVARASHGGDGDRPVTPAALSPTDASLRSAILTAFSDTASRIAYTHSVWTVGGNPTRVVDVWTSPFEGSAGQSQTRRQVVTAGGQPVEDSEMIYVLPALGSAVPANCQGQIDSPKPPPVRAENADVPATDGRLIDVDYASRSWSDQPNTCIPVTQPTDAAQIRSDIASGDWTVLGHDDIDGQPAVELDLGGPIQARSADLLWVDARTFLPIQARASKSGLPAASDSLVTTYRFLSNTPENQRNLATPIPAGFIRTATPPAPPNH
jgi:hypothetical protein